MRRIQILVLLSCLAVGCTGQANTQSAGSPASSRPTPAAPVTTPAERPLPAESNPPGDIPDTQAFVVYSSAVGGYRIDVPESWARSQRGADVTFVDKFDGMSVTVAPAIAKSRAAIDVLEQGARAGRDFQISQKQLPEGSAVVATFTSNSNTDPVTGKRVRLDDRAIVFVRGRQTATILLWAPLGADNVDQWNRVESSFRWR